MKSGLCYICATERRLVLIRNPSAEVHYCESCGRIPADSPNNWVTPQMFFEQEKARLDREHNVIERLDDLKGWEITGFIRWKPGVVRWFAEAPNHGGGRTRISGYARDEVFARLQLPS